MEQRPAIQFLGTGTAFNHGGRGAQSVLILPGASSAFLVDAGPTLMPVLMREGNGCPEIDRMFVTHLHGDHFAGWPFLLLHLVFLDERTRPFDVYGPVGTRETLEELAALCYREIQAKRRFELRYHELAVRAQTNLDGGAGLRFDVLPMKHHPSSIGYRFRLDRDPSGRSVAVTGDTEWCGALEALSLDCDVLIVECTTLAPGLGGHLSLEEIRGRIDRLRARQVVLVHLTDEVAAGLALDPIPGVTPAHDGMVLPL